MSDRFRDDPDETKAKKTEGVRIIGAEEAAEAMGRGDVAQRRGEGELRFGDRPASPPEDARPALRFPLPPAESSPARPRPAAPPPVMPHWADPPTGEVPKVLSDAGDPDPQDDLEAWSSFAQPPRWRDTAGDWNEPDFEPGSLGRGVSAPSAVDPDDELFASLDEPRDLPPLPGLPSARPPRARPPRPRPSRSPAGDGPLPLGRDLPSAALTGVGLAVVALVLFGIGNPAPMFLVVGVLVLCAAELFGALQRGGYQPATLLGLVATAGLALGAYWRGEAAIPLVLGLALIFTLLWYLLGITRSNPLMNAGVTILGIGMVGLLGSYGALMLALPDGIGLLIGVIVAVVANDVGALLVGRRFGRAPVAPAISPGKTIEGLVGGTLASVAVSWIVLSWFPGLEPWDAGSAIALGLVVSVAAPLGDLCESMIKRDLGVKDMGTLLPGHGGVYDRFDALLFALPAAFYLCRLLDLA